jgi:nitronate monooxygenase
MTLPKIIQGGMGVAISDWRLARAVALQGQLGVVSGTGIAIVMTARLQEGDPQGAMRRALAAFPFQDAAQRVLDRYFVEGGIPRGKPYRRPPMWSMKPSRELEELTVIANFVEVFLAKEGHHNPIGINLLEKVQMPTMASLYGAMLAGVDFVLMGAGIPLQIGGILDKLANHEPTQYRLDVLNATEEHYLHFDPRALFPEVSGTLKRPMFLPIISSFVLAQALLKRTSGRIDGFVVELPIAGGHNAPPRGQLQLNARGEPIYTEKDAVDLEKLAKLGLPFWVGGGYGNPEKLVEALAHGAAGIQVGTAFAYCDESGMAAEIKQRVIQKVLDGTIDVLTSATASPTGFPFKVVQLEGTLSDASVYEARERVCDIGYLRHLYEQDGKIGFRCPAEPVDHYVKKGGDLEDTVGRVCLCNALGSTTGYIHHRPDGTPEPAIVTSGDDLINIVQFLSEGATHYSAADVIAKLLSKISVVSDVPEPSARL